MAEGKKKGAKTIVRHYTSEEGVKGIMKDGVIKPSMAGGPDAVMGTGVYVNKMDPSQHSKSSIAKNNYDDGSKFWKRQKDEGKVDYVIEMKLDADKVKHVKEPRDIGVHRDPIHLKDVEHKIMKVPTKRE